MIRTPRGIGRTRWLALGAALWLTDCASLRTPTPEVFYRAQVGTGTDALCGDLAEQLVTTAGLARDSSYEIPLQGSRCHEILYAPDGNEVWIELRNTELTLAVRYFPHPGDLEKPTANSEALADTTIGLLRARVPGVAIERAQERGSGAAPP